MQIKYSNGNFEYILSIPNVKMKNQFSFLNQPHISALEHAIHLLPGLNRVDLIWLDSQSNDLIINSISGLDEHLQIIDIASKDQKNKINGFRKTMKSMAWLEASELPFYSDNKAPGDSIFDEALKSILCLGFPSEVDSLSNVFVFYFRKDTSEFGPVLKDSILDTSQKKVIGRLIYNSLKTILNHHSENRNTMMEYNRNIALMLQSQQQKLNEIERNNTLLEAYLDAVLYELLASVKLPADRIVLSQEVKEILRPQVDNRDFVKEVLEEAITFIKTLNFGIPLAEFKITKDHLRQFEKQWSPQNSALPNPNDSYVSHTKTYRFLDALENAALKVSQQGGKLTSTRVGGLLQQPVTAAAISDKLKNHSRKILLLLKQYPDNWSIIRNRFRPIINIQEKANESKVA